MTFDEFEKIVRKRYDESLPVFSKEQRDRYFHSEEAQECIQREYKENLKELEDGEITEKIFREGVAPTVGYCLSMMFE